MARVTWSIHENTFSKTCWIGFYTMPQSLFPSQAVKTGLRLSFYHRKGQWIQDFCGSFAICAGLPWEGRGAIHHHHPPVHPPSSEQLQHHLPGDLGCWQPVLRDEICVSLSPVSADMEWT